MDLMIQATVHGKLKLPMGKKQMEVMLVKTFLSRKEYSKVLASADYEQIVPLRKILEDKYQVRVVRPAQKTLTMMQFREPVKSSLFYLGEVLCSECIVEIAGVKGAAVMIGDDFAKTTAAAMIDAAYNGNLPELQTIDQSIRKIAAAQKYSRGALNAELRKSQVTFNTMGE